MHLTHMKTYLTHCYSSKLLVVCRQPRLLVNLTAPFVLYPEKTPQERRNSLCSTFCTQSVSSCKLTSWLKPTEKPATHKSTPLCSDQPLLVAVWSWLDLFESSRPHADFCPLTYTHTHVPSILSRSSRPRSPVAFRSARLKVVLICLSNEDEDGCFHPFHPTLKCSRAPAVYQHTP